MYPMNKHGVHTRMKNREDRRDRIYTNLHANREFPQAGIKTIRSKLVMKIYDEYTNIQRGMYSTRFNGSPSDRDASRHTFSW